MIAIRGLDVWRIVWIGSESALVLYKGEKEIWRMAVASDREVLKGSSAFKVIAGQFDAHNERAAVSTYKAPRDFTTRLVAGLKAEVSSPGAIARSLFTVGRWFLMFMGLVLLVTMCSQWRARSSGNLPPGSHYGVTAPSREPVAVNSEVPPEMRDRTLGDALSATEMQVVANAAREMGIQMRPSGQPFVIFSDPNCPSCKDLEPKLSQIDPRFVPVIVPVSFKDGSEELVKNVLCAKDTVSAWSAAIGGYAPTGDAVSDGSCAGAADKATKANGAFVALNFTGTPTLVSATGKVIAGSGSLDDINKWLAENGGLKDDAAR